MDKKAGAVGDMARQKLIETAEMAAQAAEMAKNLPDEHAWALDHASTAHDDVSEVHGFLRSLEPGQTIDVDVEPSGEMQTSFDGQDGSPMVGDMGESGNMQTGFGDGDIQNPNMPTSLEGQDGGRMMPSLDPEARVAGSDEEIRTAARKSKRKGKKNTPTNPSLWARAKAAAKKKFDVYPSAYANGWAVQWYNKHGGGWRSSGGKKK